MINLLRRNRSRNNTDNEPSGGRIEGDSSTSEGASNVHGDDTGVSSDAHAIPRTQATVHRVDSEETLLSMSLRARGVRHGGDNYTANPISSTSDLTRTTSDSSLITTASTADTVVDLVLGHAVSDFNLLRTLPVVSFIFKKGLFVFPSEESLALFKTKNCDTVRLKKLGLAMPVLQMNIPMMAAFKRNYPTIVFNRILPSTNESQDVQKVPFCQVFTKFLRRTHTTRFILHITPNGVQDDPENFRVVMFTSAYGSFTDCRFKKTKMRWVGTTPAIASRGSGFFKLVVLNDSVPSLIDGIRDDDVNPQPSMEFLRSTTRIVTSSDMPPVTRFSDKSSTTLPWKGLLQLGDVKLVEVFSRSDTNSCLDVADSSLVLTCMALVLRDQEVRKNKGNGRYSDAAVNGALFY